MSDPHVVEVPREVGPELGAVVGLNPLDHHGEPTPATLPTGNDGRRLAQDPPGTESERSGIVQSPLTSPLRGWYCACRGQNGGSTALGEAISPSPAPVSGGFPCPAAYPRLSKFLLS